MDNPRSEKVAVVDEVRDRLSGASAALLTEYRGLNVTSMAQLRRDLREAGGEYHIYKNSLVRFAARDLGIDIKSMLTGPTAIAFVDGDPVHVAKALKNFAKANPALVVKGGVLGDKLLTAVETSALADVEPREVLLARLAGAIAAPMVQFAGLLQALPRNFAYGLKALIDQGGAPGAPADAPPVVDEAPSDAAPAADEASVTDDASAAADDITTDTDPIPADVAGTPAEEN
ncbi:MAG: 50S ribosomal protein L10 [Acidimicrobiia bacterium]|jgi:large subunit ribosomal protein L10|nr:50S ribosomal protein L10 [Acidimicrobiia bacterium]